jgi:hypothetical protein
MSFFVYHRSGASESDPPLTSLPALLDEIETPAEGRLQRSISLVHESEWALEVRRDGHVTFENVERVKAARHMTNVPRTKILEMLESLARGDLASLERESWKPGY